MEEHETVVIGAGQAGLATSHCLSHRGHGHLVLERGRIAETWRSRRWDSFTLVGPNWTCSLPDAPYGGTDPDGFMPRDELVAYFERYATALPIRTGVTVRRLTRLEREDGYELQLDQGAIRARNVVVATGAYQRPKLPAGSTAIDADVLQIHSDSYRDPAQLPEGGVLVVGSGQSGAQIAEELALAGRDVHLSTGGTGWYPRRHRGRDNSLWREEMGMFKDSVDTLTSPAARLSPVPMMTGRHGGRDISLWTLAATGVTLAGRFAGASGKTVRTTDDLDANMARSDDVARALMKRIDEFIRDRGIDAPPAESHAFSSATVHREQDIDLRKAGIRSIVWATGYELDFSWVALPIFDDQGYPIQRQGVTAIPGLYFVGLHWMHTRGSGLIKGVGIDADHIAGHITETRRLAAVV